MSGNAAADGSRLRVVGRSIQVLAFGTFARRESCAMASAQLATSSDDAKSIKFAVLIVSFTGYANRGWIHHCWRRAGVEASRVCGVELHVESGVELVEARAQDFSIYVPMQVYSNI